MSRRPTIVEIEDGVLLSRNSEVHRDIGQQTACGRVFGVFAQAGVAPVSNVQAIVFKLRLCVSCYPGHHQTRGGAA